MLSLSAHRRSYRQHCATKIVRLHHGQVKSSLRCKGRPMNYCRRHHISTKGSLVNGRANTLAQNSALLSSKTCKRSSRTKLIICKRIGGCVDVPGTCPGTLPNTEAKHEVRGAHGQ